MARDKRITSLCVIICFLFSVVPYRSNAQGVSGLPEPGTMINLSRAYVPLSLTGLTVHPENPLQVDFIVSTGDSRIPQEQIKGASLRLIKYFLACLAIPENDQWVNLSPYEKDRIIPQELGQTALGRDMLSQDYILKQLTASLIYPEHPLGKDFWDKVYAKAQQKYGTTQIPMNTFNKVWIVPDTSDVYAHGNTVFVVKSHLKVMLEEDYLALQDHKNISSINKKELVLKPDTHSYSSFPNVFVGSSYRILAGARNPDTAHSIASNIIRQIILPEIEHEVNSGENFATLRQIYNSMILSVWYKQNLRDSLLNQVYTNKKKMSGVSLTDTSIKDKIYRQYLEAYKKGVFDYIKEDIDRTRGEKIPRKYFSGGVVPVFQNRQVPREYAMKTWRAAGNDANTYLLASQVVAVSSKVADGRIDPAMIDDAEVAELRKQRRVLLEADKILHLNLGNSPGASGLGVSDQIVRTQRDLVRIKRRLKQIFQFGNKPPSLIGKISIAQGDPATDPDDKIAMADRAADDFLKELDLVRAEKRGTGKPPVVVLGTGEHLEALIEALLRRYEKDEKVHFDDVILFGQDQYGGASNEAKDGYYYQIWKNFVNKLNKEGRKGVKGFHAFQGDAKNPYDEVNRIPEIIHQLGGVDLVVVAGGRNGHFAFVLPTVIISDINEIDTDGMLKLLRYNNKIEIARDDMSEDELIQWIDKIYQARQYQREHLGENEDCIQDALNARMDYFNREGIAIPQDLREQIIAELKRLGPRTLIEQKLSFYLPEGFSKSTLWPKIYAANKVWKDKIEFRNQSDYRKEPAIIEDLSLTEIFDNSRFFPSLDAVYLKAYTMFGLILQAKHIFHIAFKVKMAEVLFNMITGRMTASNPFSFLARARGYRAIFGAKLAEAIRAIGPQNARILKVLGPSYNTAMINVAKGATMAPEAANGGIDLNSRYMKVRNHGQLSTIHFNQAMITQWTRGDFSGIDFNVFAVTRVDMKAVLGVDGESSFNWH